jgi:hypothetical protein
MERKEEVIGHICPDEGPRIECRNQLRVEQGYTIGIIIGVVLVLSMIAPHVFTRILDYVFAHVHDIGTLLREL